MGITLPTTPFAISITGEESNGSSCEGRGEAAEETDRAEEGTNSIESHSAMSGFNVESKKVKTLTLNWNREIS